ncbi:35_t:CDS:1, partial [Cetraspora pellucida]
PSFINVKIANMIIDKIGISRYFIQKLCLGWGESDIQLNNLNFTILNNSLYDVELVKTWASDLPLPVYISILTKGDSLYKEKLFSKGNDMKLLYLLSGGNLTIEHARAKIDLNIENIKNLIIQFKFAPFPPRPYGITISNPSFPSSDGYESNAQLHTI